MRRNPRRERPERAASSQPRATPWVSAYKRLRPVRAKVWANGWLLLLPLQGVGNGYMAPRALPWATDLLGFQPAQGRRQGFFRTISTYLIFLDFEHPTLRGRCANMQRRFEAKHCSSLCSQSEGGEYYGGQARAENPRKPCPRFSLRVRGPHFASKVSYNAGAADFRYVAVALTLRAK